MQELHDISACHGVCLQIMVAVIFFFGVTFKHFKVQFSPLIWVLLEPFSQSCLFSLSLLLLLFFNFFLSLLKNSLNLSFCFVGLGKGLLSIFYLSYFLSCLKCLGISHVIVLRKKRSTKDLFKNKSLHRLLTACKRLHLCSTKVGTPPWCLEILSDISSPHLEALSCLCVLFIF